MLSHFRERDKKRLLRGPPRKKHAYLWKQTVETIVVVTFTIIIIIVLLCLDIPNSSAAETVSLSYHRCVDEVVYKKSPLLYERVHYGEGKNKFAVHVERNPIRQILANAIEAIIVQKERKFGRTSDEIKLFEQAVKKDLKGESSQNGASSEKYPFGFIYSITFKLTVSEWEREVTFTNKHLGERFQVRLGRHDLGLVDFVVPFEIDQPPEFTIYTFENDSNHIIKILSPLKHKVTWK